MTLHALLVFVVGLLFAADDHRDDAVKREMAKFQGTWKFVSMEVDGKKKPPEHFNKYTVVLKGDQWTVSEGDKIAAQVTFKLDPTKEPKMIDLIDVQKKRLIRGIYAFEGDTLTVCDRGAEKGDRPSKFASKADSGLVLLVFKRAEFRDAKHDARKKELHRFQGSWQAVSIQHGDGQQASEDEVQNTRLVVKDSKFRLTGKNYTIEGSFDVNPATTPKSIDVLVTSKDGRETRLQGIYETKGKTRKSCFALSGKKRLMHFSTEKGYFGFEWKRN